MAKHKATVVVSKREGFNGWWAAGRHWAGDAQHEVELEDHEIANLVGRPGIVVLVDGKVAKATQAPANSIGVQVTPDEMAALEKLRAGAAAAPQAAFSLEKQGEPAEAAPPAPSAPEAPASSFPPPSTTLGRAPDHHGKQKR